MQSRYCALYFIFSLFSCIFCQSSHMVLVCCTNRSPTFLVFQLAQFLLSFCSGLHLDFLPSKQNREEKCKGILGLWEEVSLWHLFRSVFSGSMCSSLFLRFYFGSNCALDRKFSSLLKRNVLGLYHVLCHAKSFSSERNNICLNQDHTAP